MRSPACVPYLMKQINYCPKVYFAHGTHRLPRSFGYERGFKSPPWEDFEIRGIPAVCTYHPSALLRNSEELKRPAWEDLETLRRKIDEG